jgi:hypothetical protein
VTPAAAFLIDRTSASRDRYLGPRGLVLSAQGTRNRRVAAQHRPQQSRPSEPDQSTMLRRATFGLAEVYPHLSAHQVVTRDQAVFFGMFLGVALIAVIVRPVEVVDIAVAGLSIGFICSMALRGVLAILGENAKTDVAIKIDDKLPVYTVLVPVYREAAMIPQIALALAALDYPAGKLDIHLVVEQDDRETRTAVLAAGLDAIVVPPSLPRTKPKAEFAFSPASSGIFEFAAEFGSLG